MTETRQFAYGKDEMDGCPCPAVAAGYSPASGDSSIEPAEWYDSVIKSEFRSATEPYSPLSEEEAREAWNMTIEQLTGRYGRDSEIVQTAEEIANELGWN